MVRKRNLPRGLWRQVGLGGILLMLLAGVAVGARLTGVGEWLSQPERLRSILAVESPASPFLFVFFTAVVTAAGFPKQVVSGVAGYLYGFGAGVILTAAGSALGNIATFYVARFFCRGAATAAMGERLRKMDRLLARHPYQMTVMIRWFPISSNLAVNFLAGLSSVPGSAFHIASVVAQLPHFIVFSLVGSGVRADPGLRIAVGGLLFLVSVLLMVLAYRRYGVVETPEAMGEA